MSKLHDWSSHHFSQNLNIQIKRGFSCTNVRHVTWEMLKTEGDKSGGYRGKLDQPIEHGWGVEVCCPAFPVPEPVQAPGLGWQHQKTSCQNQQILCYQNNVVHIIWSVYSSDMSTIKHVKNIFEQRVRGIIWAPRNLQALNVMSKEESRPIPRYQITRSMRSQCKSYVAANGGHIRYWRNSYLPNVTFKYITLISCGIQRNCVSSFENLKLIHCFAPKRGILCRHLFAKNDFDC